ncbi:MAG: nitrate reductase molybdenum cofactor assembly chaperone [Alphaproteobacteria bacterium]|nr:nitrate reductase molybdenum cofactor assembly chaperone [Alphaproteobacteria bacterium]MDE2111963.1 nitrate reductase molybdenum cofactor assembly chaperone [Alphaproteobacteria bacterium]MDE2492527.1 nitrate reductase molybdenum cofactor assembly chaperone [Alphaproteobacteria bacterium]
MAAIYKVLSALLSYPTEELQVASSDIAAVVLKNTAFPAATAEALALLAVDLGSGDLLDLQACYVDLFDRSRSLSLNLFEHVHGESRDRGQAMVDLRERYRAAGLDLAGNELPDHLPLFLEFLSVLPDGKAQGYLADAAHVLRALGERLTSRGSPYAAVFAALESLAQQAPDEVLLSELRKAPEDNPNDLAAIDRAWEETEVRFGTGDAKDGCPRTAFREQLRAGARS